LLHYHFTLNRGHRYSLYDTGDVRRHTAIRLCKGPCTARSSGLSELERVDGGKLIPRLRRLPLHTASTFVAFACFSTCCCYVDRQSSTRPAVCVALQRGARHGVGRCHRRATQGSPAAPLREDARFAAPPSWNAATCGGVEAPPQEGRTHELAGWCSSPPRGRARRTA